MKDIITAFQRSRAATLVASNRALREQVAQEAVEVMTESEELPATMMTVEDFEALLAENLVGVPLALSGKVYVEIIPDPDKKGPLLQAIELEEWAATCEAVHIAWSRLDRIEL